MAASGAMGAGDVVPEASGAIGVAGALLEGVAVLPGEAGEELLDVWVSLANCLTWSLY